MLQFDGSPSDALASVLAVGPANVATTFVAMAARHPDGQDARYLEWHTLDHRPEQYRIPGLRGSQRLVSTPACRKARAVSDARFDAVDHIMMYHFDDRAALAPFVALGRALLAGGRIEEGKLPTVEMACYDLVGTVAAPRVLTGADVMPWRPALGAYLLVEQGSAPAAALAAVPGVAGVWWHRGTATEHRTDTEGLQLSVCYLDDDPIVVAARLGDALSARWATGEVVPLLAAPFQTIVPFDWSRHLP